jgi:protein transport protein SEC31
MFVPRNAPAEPQTNYTPLPVPQQTVKGFTPTNVPSLKKVDQYQQASTLGSQLYPAPANSSFMPGPPAPFTSGPPTTYHQPVQPAQFQAVPPVPSVPGTNPNQMFTPAVPPNSASRFMPSNNQGFVQHPGPSPVQPSSPTQAQPPSQPAVAPPAPPPTVQTADTSNVSAELRPVIATLTRLFDETSRALGGTQAKKREIEDNSKKIGALFAKLNTGDISPNVSSKLIQMCNALDSSDLATAMQIQIQLTTSDWDECNFWLSALKRVIKTKQNFRM